MSVRTALCEVVACERSGLASRSSNAKTSRDVSMLTVRLCGVFLASACSVAAPMEYRPGNSSGSAATTAGTVGASNASDGAGGSGGSTVPVSIPVSSSAGGAASGDAGVILCTDGGNCVCPTLAVAVIGKPGVWGDSSDTAFQNWLNSSSAGTARVDNYLDRPTLTADFLGKYGVIILASLGDTSANGPWWTFSASEMAAFQDWIENKGGGVISLSGYSADNREIDTKNALVAFSGISYQQQNISPACIIEDAQHNKMCYRCGNPYQIAEWNRTDPVVANLGRDVTMIGLDGGHPINAPADAHVAATTTTASSVSNWLVGRVVGKGRVLMFADEWITYTNQWAVPNAQNSSDPACAGLLPQELYQTSQFWYNMIRWAQPTANCFTIVDDSRPVTIW